MKKLIWFKKPKCAGTSLENFLKEKGLIYYYDKSSTKFDLNDPQYKVICVHAGVADKLGVWKKNSSGEYVKKDSGINRYNFIDKLFNTGFNASEHFMRNHKRFLQDNISFAIIRNPFDKFVSSWKYLKATKHLSAKQVLHNLPEKNYHDRLHLTRSQSSCVLDKNANVAVNYFIYMENDFSNDLRHLLAKVNLADEFHLPHDNKSKRGSVYNELSQDEIELIYEQYREDFELFGYSSNPELHKPISPINSILNT